MEPGFQVVLCAGAPDTPEIAEEMKRAVAEAQSKREGVIWIEKMVTKEVVYQLYTHAAVFFARRSTSLSESLIWRPWLVKLRWWLRQSEESKRSWSMVKPGFSYPWSRCRRAHSNRSDPDKFSRDLAEKINRLMADESLRKKFGEAGRKRAVEKFSWATIAAETKKMYESLL